MGVDLGIVLALLLASVLLFILNKPRMDVVALLVILALPLSGILTLEETLSGFSDPSVLLIAALFVIGQGLVSTGIAYQLGDWIIQRSGNSETRLLILLMLTVAGLGAVMSSTGVVAIFIPIVLSIANRLGSSPARLLMPMSVAGLTSGMLTLVATAPNMVVHSELVRSGNAGFGFFSITPIGLAVLALGIGYMLLTRRWLERKPAGNPARPRQTLASLAARYRLTDRERRLRVLPDSPLANQPLNALALRSEYGINVIALERPQRLRTLLLVATGNNMVQAGDILLVDLASPAIALVGVYQQLGLQAEPLSDSYYNRHAHQLGLAEVALPPESALLGKTVQGLGFRSEYQLNVVGLRRQGQALDGLLIDERLKSSDTLLVAGTWKAINRLHGLSRDVLLLSVPAEVDEVAPTKRKAPYALLSLAVMIALMVSGVVPNLLAALIGCLLMGAFRCIDMDSAWRSIHWPSLLLIVGMLPFALALQKTGGIDLAVNGLLQLLGDAGPRALIAALFALTAVIGLFISNTATAVLMAPVAIATAQALGVSPMPFAITVAVAASAAFMTPVSSPVNTLVLAPGGYRFIDFVRIGVPLTLLVMLASTLLIPLLFPL
ncbi:MAG TPA: SLC13 family permease [Pseudomonas sp.]|nr:SLC13 family permease [Pseudomonas sp.]MAQ51133.1 SLC13 family permease [Pseudomonas sp.]MBF77554.1 SLC13 family permease [Pseudomonadales bacterium]MBU32226.1 SLC13 family permease [Pseudomonadales bacterium]HCA24083.1 SLC13 family permease [Pseudomonas sp.]|tara:strand:- start:7280 stop:9106 length:1827 start_codon:yes stop_codon:yes gene_type:complete